VSRSEEDIDIAVLDAIKDGFNTFNLLLINLRISENALPDSPARHTNDRWLGATNIFNRNEKENAERIYFNKKI